MREIEPRQWRFCRAIACTQLNGSACKLEQCEHPDKTQALKERRDVLAGVKCGG